MSSAEIKSDLHKLIVETEDLDILLKIKEYFSLLKYQKTDWWDALDEKARKNIEKGIEQLHEGQLITHEEIRAEVDKILNKQ